MTDSTNHSIVPTRKRKFGLSLVPVINLSNPDIACGSLLFYVVIYDS